MNREQRDDRHTELKESYAGYEVYDSQGDKIGKIDDLFVDENDRLEYIGVKTGFLGTKTTLVPIEAVRIDEERRVIEVSRPKSEVKEGPAFDDDEEITPEYEEQVRSHYGLDGGLQGAANRGGAYGDYYQDEDYAASRSPTAAGMTEEERRPSEREGVTGEERRDRKRESSGAAGPGMRMGDREAGGEFREHPPGEEGVGEHESDLEDEDELRVQRVEEELRASTREREAGAMRVRKRVRTDREQVVVPKRREEVSVERVPVEGREAPEAEIGEDEIVVPVTEEEVVVEKRPVVKEEIRLRKDVAHEEEVVEADLRKEEVDIEDQTERGGGHGGEDAGRGSTDLSEETRRHGR